MKSPEASGGRSRFVLSCSCTYGNRACIDDTKEEFATFPWTILIAAMMLR